MNKPIVISAFPGTGKTYACQYNMHITLIDSDSSKFSWIYDDENNTNERNPEFPHNYIDHIKKNISCLPDGSIIFVSSHEDVKKAMNDAEIKFLSVYPDKNNKTNHIANLKRRSTGLNDDKFVSLIESKWDEWIPDPESANVDNNKYENCVGTIYLGHNEYLGNILYDINSLYNWCISNHCHTIYKNEICYDCTQDVMNHKKKVSENLSLVIQSLTGRSIHHDNSKLYEPEKSVYDKVTPKLKELVYGSYEYQDQLVSMNTALDHHYLINKHHPEHFENGINDMNLIDITEMLCDWMAASEQTKEGNIFKSIEINQKRFGYSDSIKNILLNTAKHIISVRNTF